VVQWYSRGIFVMQAAIAEVLGGPKEHVGTFYCVQRIFRRL